MRAAASGPVQAVCPCGKGCGDTCLNMPVGKIYPEDFAGRANRDDHAGRPAFHILGAIDEFHGLGKIRTAAGAGDDLGRAAGHPGAGVTTVTPIRPHGEAMQGAIVSLVVAADYPSSGISCCQRMAAWTRGFWSGVRGMSSLV